MGACGRALGSELLCLISSSSSKHYEDEERKGEDEDEERKGEDEDEERKGEEEECKVEKKGRELRGYSVRLVLKRMKIRRRYRRRSA
jgi:hypothetical protein